MPPIGTNNGTALGASSFLTQPQIRRSVWVLFAVEVGGNKELAWFPLAYLFFLVTPSNCKTIAVVAVTRLFWRRHTLSENGFQYIDKLFLGSIE